MRPQTKLRQADQLWEAFFDGLPPIPSLRVSEWADKYRVLSGEGSAEPGKFRSDRIPYQRELMDACLEPDVNEVVMMIAAQLGKSETINNIHGYFIHADPSPQLMVQPTIELAEAYSKDRIAPMCRDTEVLSKLVINPRSRDSGNTTLAKRYPGGSLVLVGANSPAGLAGRPRRVVLQDEIDRFPLSAGTEGDPCALADKRTEAFPNAVKVKTSTPTVKGASKIEVLYEKSDQRKWHVCCPKCRHQFVMMWAHVKWEGERIDEAWLECPAEACKAHLSDSDRVAMIRAGKWVPTAPFKGIRGYWLNGLNILFGAHKGYKNRLHEFVAEFLKAKDGGADKVRVWVNTFLAETYEEDSLEIDPRGITDRLEDYSPEDLPEQVLEVTAAADVQSMRIEVLFMGWGADEESWAVQKVVLEGDTRRDEVWQALDNQLVRTFTRDDGVILPVGRAFIDMGYNSKRVIEFCAPRIGRGVFPCRGLNRVGLQVPPLLPAKPSRNNKAHIPHWNVGVTVAKTAIYDRLPIPAGGARTMHFPKGYGFDEDYFKQLTVERKVTKFSAGSPYFIYVKPNNASRNEALDLTVYNLAAMHSLGPVAWLKLAANRKATAPKPQLVPIGPEEPKDTPLPVPPVPQEKPGFARPAAMPTFGRGRGRGGFVKGW